MVVVGGGLIGIETAAEVAEAYPTLRVALVTEGVLGAGLSEPAKAHLRRAFARLGVDVRDETRVIDVAEGEARLAQGEALPIAFCVWAGFMRAAAVAEEAGLPVNEAGQILVDSTLRSPAAPNVFAAGDAACAQLPNGHTLRMACATAMPLGAHAADNVIASIVGEERRPFRFAYFARCVSLGRKDGVIQWVRG